MRISPAASQTLPIPAASVASKIAIKVMIEGPCADASSFPSRWPAGAGCGLILSIVPAPPRAAGALSESRFHSQESNMPTIRVELMEGRTPEQKKNLVSALTRAVVETLGAKPEAVDVLLYDIKRGDWATGGQLWSERK